MKKYIVNEDLINNYKIIVNKLCGNKQNIFTANELFILSKLLDTIEFFEEQKDNNKKNKQNENTIS